MRPGRPGHANALQGGACEGRDWASPGCPGLQGTRGPEYPRGIPCRGARINTCCKSSRRSYLDGEFEARACAGASRGAQASRFRITVERSYSRDYIRKFILERLYSKDYTRKLTISPHPYAPSRPRLGGCDHIIPTMHTPGPVAGQATPAHAP